MPFSKTGGAFLLALTVGACGVVAPLVGPLYDRRMDDAPVAACAAINGPAPLGEPSAEQRAQTGSGPAAMKQCFTLVEELADGGRRAWQGGPLREGQSMVAIYKREPGCFGRPDDTAGPRMFTHATLTGSSPGAGEAELSSWDLHGRAGQARKLRWSGPFQNRTFALAGVGSANMNPDGLRIRVSQGSLDPAHLCFKSY